MFDMPDDIRCRQLPITSLTISLPQKVISCRYYGRMRLLVTTNGAESIYHGHLNAEVNAPHPNIYIVDTLLRQQAATYVTVSSLSCLLSICTVCRRSAAILYATVC